MSFLLLLTLLLIWILLCFQLPQVCPYQEVSYTITLQRVDVERDAAIVVGPIIVPPYSDQRLVPGQETIRNGLVMGARYSVVVSVNTSGGMSTSSRLSFVGKYNESHDSRLVVCENVKGLQDTLWLCM